MCERPDVYGRELIRARKAHRCCECHGTIYPRDLYHRHSGLWDGAWATFKVCEDCEQIRTEILGTVDLDDGLEFGGLTEIVLDGCDTNLMRRFIEIMRRREASIPEWILKRERGEE